MAINFKQPGDIIQWVNGSGADKVSGQVVVIGQVIGVCLVNIANGATGAVALDGVFEVPKVTTAVIAAGDSLLWDASAAKFDAKSATPATGDVTGPPAHAFAAAGNGATTLLVKLTGVPGTVT